MTSIVLRLQLCSSLVLTIVLVSWCEGSSKLGRVWPHETNVELDSPVEVFCSLDLQHSDVANSGWTSSDLRFFRPNGTLRAINDSSVKPVNESTIAFSRTSSSASDSGDYYCNVRRGDGTLRNIGAAQVFVGTRPTPPDTVRCISYDLQQLTCSWVPPKNPVKTKYSVFFRLHSRAMINRSFKCPQGKHPRNTCTWRMDTDPPFRPRPLLHFGFDATNKLGNATFEQVLNFNIYQNFKPAPVNNLTVAPVDSKSLEITWVLSVFMQYTDVHLNHSIRWRPVSCGETEWSEAVVKLPHGTKHQYKLEDLPYANQRYEVAVQAIPSNASFDDLWSDPTVAFASTLPSLPETPIVSDASYEVVVSTADNERTVVVYWVKPDVCSHNGDGLLHRVELVHDGSVVDVQEVEGTKSYAEFHRVRNDVDYDAIITAVNEIGPSAESAKIRVKAQKNSPRVPYSVSSILYAPGTYEVSWRPPVSTLGEISSFTIFFCQHESPVPNRCDGKIGWVQVPHSVTRYNVTDLDPSGSYQFAVAVNSESATSGMFWATCMVEYNHIKRPLRHVWITTQASFDMDLAWRHECQSSFGLISAVNIRYCKVNSCEEKCLSEQKVVRIAGDGENATVYGLEPFSTYKFTVGVESRAGESPPNDPPVCGSTKQGAPAGPPLDVATIDVDENSVELAWSLPAKVNGLVHSSKIWVDGRVLTFNGNSTSWRVKELESYRNYSFSVQTCTHNGELCSPKSPEVFARTKMSEPGQMSRPWGRFLNSTAILVFWDPPEEPNGPLNFYEVNVTVVSGTGVVETFMSNQTGSQQAQVTVPECNPSTELQYSVNVRAVNEHGDGGLLPGPWSTVGLVTCGDSWKSETLIGLIVGCSLTVVVISALVWALGRKLRRKWVEMATVDVKMPEKFGDFNGYNPALQPKTSFDDFPKPRMAYLRMDSSPTSSEDGGSTRDRNWSGSTEESKLEKTSLWSAEKRRMAAPDDAISGCSAHGSDETASTGSQSHHGSDSGTDIKLEYEDESAGYTKMMWPNAVVAGIAELRKRTPSPIGLEDQDRLGVEGYVTAGVRRESAASSTQGSSLHPGYCRLGRDAAYVDYSGMSTSPNGASTGYVAVGFDSNAPTTSNTDPAYVVEGIAPPKNGVCSNGRRPDDHDEDESDVLDVDEEDEGIAAALDLGILSIDGKGIVSGDLPKKKPVTSSGYVLA